MPEDEAGPSSCAPPTRNDEAQKLCQALKDEQYELDEVAEAVCKGGLPAGYAVYLQKFPDDLLEDVPRTWKDAPESQAFDAFFRVQFEQEYQERQACFAETFLWHLKAAKRSPFKCTATNAFFDLKPNEHQPHGFWMDS